MDGRTSVIESRVGNPSAGQRPPARTDSSGRADRHRGRMIAAVAASVATVLVVAMVFAASRGLGRVDARPAATAHSDTVLTLAGSPAAIPQILEDKARAALEPSVGSLGSAVFMAGDSSSLPVSEYLNAKSMDVAFGDDPDHTWELYLTDGGFGDTGTSIPCGTGVTRGFLMSCENITSKDGNAIDVTVQATILDQALRNLSPEEQRAVAWSMVDQRSLTARDLPRLRLQRKVVVTRPDRSVVSVYEQAFAPTSLNADAVFDTPVDSLIKLANDPTLRLPR